MSISAQLAQNSKLYIAGSAASALNLVSCAVGYPTILTFLNATVATALLNGDVVTIAGCTGDDAALLNVVTTVTHKAIGATNTTFVVDIDTTGKTIVGTSATATPSAWIQIKELKAFKPSGASATKIDVTDLDSTAKEYRSGLVDNGTFSADIHILETDAGQIAALAQFVGSLTKNMKLVSPAKTRTFNATCLKFPTTPDSAVDSVQTGNAEWQINGSVTVS